MARLLAVVAMTLVGACGRGDDEQRALATTIRVSAPFGLAPLSPGPWQTGSSAAVMDLLFEPIDWHMRTRSVGGASVTFERLPSAPAIDELVATLRTDEMVLKEKLDENALRVTMTSAAHAAGLAAYKFGGFARGVFVADVWNRGDPVQRLRAADGRVIELVEMPVQEQWRRFLARDIDVVPVNTPTQHRFYDGLKGVRTLDVPSTRTMTLFFNMGGVPSAAERRQISALIDRAAVALVCAGTAGLRSDELVVEEVDVSSLLPPRSLSIGYLASDLEAVDAVRVVRIQLERVGYSIELRAMTIDELVKGQSDLSISPFRDGVERVKAIRQGGYLGYQNAALDQAVDRGDLAGATAILERDVPMIPLYRTGGFAVVDAHLCGGQPEVLGDWTWLGDLRPCEDGR